MMYNLFHFAAISTDAFFPCCLDFAAGRFTVKQDSDSGCSGSEREIKIMNIMYCDAERNRVVL